MQRYSKKREGIIEYLKNSKEHPDAERIYNDLKKDFPDLSLATVYRNIKELEKTGKIRKVATVLDKERYDGNVLPHVHAVCKKCGKVMDVDDMVIPQELIKKAQELTGFSAEYSNLQIYGLCKDCKKQKV